jgi:hypothetical protein
MKRIFASRTLRLGFLLFVVLGMPRALAPAQERAVVPPGGTVNVTVTAASAPPPPVSITLSERHGQVIPIKGKCTHTGGGLIDVASLAPDTVIVTMTGVVIANSDMKFDLDQGFEVSFDDPKIKRAKLTLEGRVTGLLRGEKKGSAEYAQACATVLAAPVELVTVCVPPHMVCDCDNLAVNDHDGPRTVTVAPGKYLLHQAFFLSAHSKSLIYKRPSAEFAPEPALDPLWISYWEPFHGVKKDSFGFQVILKVAADTAESTDDKKAAESVPAPKKQ